MSAPKVTLGAFVPPTGNRGSRNTRKNNGRTVTQTNSNEVESSTSTQNNDSVTKAVYQHMIDTFQAEQTKLQNQLQQEQSRCAVAEHTVKLLSQPQLGADKSIEGHPLVLELRQALAAKAVEIDALPEVRELRDRVAAHETVRNELEKLCENKARALQGALEALEVEKAASLKLCERLAEQGSATERMPRENPPGVPGITIIDIEKQREPAARHGIEIDALTELTKPLLEEITTLWDKAPNQLNTGEGKLSRIDLIMGMGIDRTIASDGKESKFILSQGLVGRFQKCCETYTNLIADINGHIKALRELKLKEAEILSPITPAIRKVILPKLILSEESVQSKETLHDASYRSAMTLLANLETAKAKVEEELFLSRKKLNYIWQRSNYAVFSEQENKPEKIAAFEPVALT